MVIKNKKRFVSVATQERMLKHYFPASKTEIYMGASIEWEGELMPTPFSQSYKVRVAYLIGKWPKIYVVEPKKLSLYPGEKKLPHVWDHDKQQLCLFLDGLEWNRSKLLAETIVPWAAEWLYFYEIWLKCGKWKGGGTHPRSNQHQ